jgi:hypothetical protein
VQSIEGDQFFGSTDLCTSIVVYVALLHSIGVSDTPLAMNRVDTWIAARVI